MRYLVIASVLIASTPANAVPAHKAVKKNADNSSICTSLTSDYEGASKKLAMLKVEGAADDSAPRATMRETQSTNIIDQARITMELMKTNGCKSPTAAPSADRYFVAALSCLAKQTTQHADAEWAAYEGKPQTAPESPTECDQSKWTAN